MGESLLKLLRVYGLQTAKRSEGSLRSLGTVEPLAMTALLSCGGHFLAATNSISIWAPPGSAATPTKVRAGRGFGSISR